MVAGHIVSLGADGKLHNFDMLGYVVVGTSLGALALLWMLHRSAHFEAIPQASKQR